MTPFNNLTINSGATVAASQDIQIAGNWTNDGTFTPGMKTVTFNGTTSQTIGGAAITTFNNIVFDTGSSVTAPAGDMKVTGNWTKGVFTHNGGSVVFSGTTQQTIGGSKTAFNNVTVNIGATVVIPSNKTKTPTVAGTLENNGVLEQKDAVNSANVAFLKIDDGSGNIKYHGVDVDSTAGSVELGSVSVTVQGNANSSQTPRGFPHMRGAFQSRREPGGR